MCGRSSRGLIASQSRMRGAPLPLASFAGAQAAGRQLATMRHWPKSAGFWRMAPLDQSKARQSLLPRLWGAFIQYPGRRLGLRRSTEKNFQTKLFKFDAIYSARAYDLVINAWGTTDEMDHYQAGRHSTSEIKPGNHGFF
jgi:hypothetical protein